MLPAFLVIIIIIVLVLFGLVVFFGAPYIPSHKKQLQRAFQELRPLTNNDHVVDCGSGDGVVLRQALRAGAGSVTGYELNPLLALVSQLLTRQATIHVGSYWHVTPPAKTTVVYLFGVGRDMRHFKALMERWRTSVGHPLDVIVYGHKLPGTTPKMTVGAHHLYSL